VAHVVSLSLSLSLSFFFFLLLYGRDWWLRILKRFKNAMGFQGAHEIAKWLGDAQFGVLEIHLVTSLHYNEAFRSKYREKETSQTQKLLEQRNPQHRL